MTKKHKRQDIRNANRAVMERWGVATSVPAPAVPAAVAAPVPQPEASQTPRQRLAAMVAAHEAKITRQARVKEEIVDAEAERKAVFDRMWAEVERSDIRHVIGYRDDESDDRRAASDIRDMASSPCWHAATRREAQRLLRFVPPERDERLSALWDEEATLHFALHGLAFVPHMLPEYVADADVARYVDGGYSYRDAIYQGLRDEVRRNEPDGERNEAWRRAFWEEEQVAISNWALDWEAWDRLASNLHPRKEWVRPVFVHGGAWRDDTDISGGFAAWGF